MSRAKRALSRTAFFLVARCGSDGRVSELKAHLEDADDMGLTDVASLAGLAARANVGRLGTEVAWLLLGFPAAVVQLLFLGVVYETHFPAWDFVGTDEVAWTAEALMWNRMVEVVGLLSVIGAAVGLGRAIRCVARGNVVLPLLFGLLFVLSVTQMERFVDKAVWYRMNGGYDALRAENVNDIQPYSIALFATFAALPLVYVLVDLVNARRVA